MDPLQEQKNIFNNDKDNSFFRPLFRVTTLSKFFALFIFIIIPFVGGYVGYNYAVNEIASSPEESITISKIESTKKTVFKNVASDINIEIGDSIFFGYKFDDLQQEPNYNGLTYNISKGFLVNEGYLDNRNSYYSLNVTKISRNVVLLFLGSQEEGFVSLLYDEKNRKIIRKIDIAPMDLYTISNQTWLVAENSDSSLPYANLVNVSGKTVTIYDFIKNTSEVIYTELRSDTVLTESCEMGCTGLLYIDTDQNLVVGRYQKQDNMFSKYIDSIVIQVPEKYKSKSQQNYKQKCITTNVCD